MAVATNTALGTVLLAGDLAGSSNANSPQLTPTGVTPGVYKGASVVVDSKGRIIYARGLAGYDVGCATQSECGTVSVTANHHINLNNKKISIKKASTTDYGVVKLGAGFGKDCCEIFVDYVEATPTTLGVVTVPTSGNLLVDSAGSLSVPIGSTSTIGLVYAPVGGPITNTANTLSYTPPDASASTAGFVTVGNGFVVAAGELSIPAASATDKGLFRFDSSFAFTGNSYSYQVVATASTSGLVKIGGGFIVDTDGTLNRGAGYATSTTKGVISVPALNGMSVTSGVISWSAPSATTSAKGAVSIGSNMAVTSGTVRQVTASGTATKGIVSVSGNGNLVINNGVIDFGPNIALTDTANTWTKAQRVTPAVSTATSALTMDMATSNIFDVTLGGNVTVSAPLNSVSGGQYTLILRQDATGSRTISWPGSFVFLDAHGNGASARVISAIPGSISVVSITYAGGVYICQINRNFA